MGGGRRGRNVRTGGRRKGGGRRGGGIARAGARLLKQVECEGQRGSNRSDVRGLIH